MFLSFGPAASLSPFHPTTAPFAQLGHQRKSSTITKMPNNNINSHNQHSRIGSAFEMMDDTKNPAQTSINIFRAFIRRLPNGDIDATAITSTACYRVWLNSRKSKPSCPEKAFQRALSGHITGVDGRVPFDQDEEEAILRAVRRKARWECFKHCDIKFGESGFRTKGFHEKAISGEILKTHPKKRAKRALEKILKISQAMEDEAHLDSADQDEDDDDDVDNRYHDDEDGEESNDSEDLDSTRSKKRKHPKMIRKKVTIISGVESVSSGNSTSSYTSSSDAYPLRLQDSANLALRMPIPSCIASASSAASAMLSMLASMLLSMSAMGGSWGTCLMTLTRAVLLSRGWFSSPTMEQARMLLAKVNAKHPDDYVILADFTAKEGKDRVILQNEKSVELFGRISRHDGGFTAIRCPSFELWNVIKLYADASMAPSGQEVRGQLWLYLKSELRLVDLTMLCDDSTHIIIERGRVVEGAVLPPHLAAQLNSVVPSVVPRINVPGAAGPSLGGPGGRVLSVARDFLSS